MSNITTTNNQTNTSMDMFEIMEKAYKFATILAKSDIIPAHYRGKPENVFIAVQSAYRMNLDPMLIMQNTYVVGGKLGMNTAFAISLANVSGLFNGGIKYRVEGKGDGLAITAYATIKSTGEEIAYTVSMKDAVAENWTKNAKYKTLPELMLRYRAATFLIRTHAPEVVNGMHMVEELEDVSAAHSPDIITHTSKAAALSERLSKNFSAPEEPTKEVVDEQGEVTLVTNVENVETMEYRAILWGKLKDLVEWHGVSAETQAAWCAKAGVLDIEELPEDAMQKCISHLSKEYGSTPPNEERDELAEK